MGILRVLLAISVILDHSGPLWVFRLIEGRMAVQSFFIISGFYMSLILDTKYVGKNSYMLFITNRFLRIFPVYWVLLFMVILISVSSGFLTGQWYSLSPYIEFHRHMGLPAFSLATISNLIILGQDAALFLGMNVQTGMLFFTENSVNTDLPFWPFLIIPQAWSLSLELLFYLVAPLIVRRNVKFILSLIVVSLLLRIFIYSGLGWAHDPWTYRFLPTEMFFFLAGNISYRIYNKINGHPAYKKPAGYVTAAFFLTLLLYTYIPLSGEYKLWAYYLFVVLSIPFIFYFSKSSKKDNRIGELSYPIYLVHYHVVCLLGFSPEQFMKNSFYGVIVVILSVLSAFLLLKLVADPVEKYRQSRLAKGRGVGCAIKAH